MGRPDFDINAFKKAFEKNEESNSKLSQNKNLKHILINYRKGELNNKEVVIITLRNSLGAKNYIVPNNSQLAMRSQYYWINNIKDSLEEGLTQEKLVNPESFIELNINGEVYQVNKELI
ncbi:hypothetical protein [Christiangramia echinicola]|uniref:Uncharacterized protein n=1 Tax=Christiangramia echinicola TaxID=279359 RepID=A0A1H1RJH9_9FLAO|nr:hypothetical protein [Christiangramia echinicola]SDS35884.1 hypothetical protein SAMN04488552_2919 [Christiangramia echinicola]